MTKRKRNQPTIEDILERPWCYYCERDFDDLKILISHQKAKHYKCSMCARRLNTAGGLGVHMSQVHKETLQYIDNALPNRKDASIEIFGMEGIPQIVLDHHKERITKEYFKAVAERRKETGNPPAGTQAQNPAKKLKLETAEEIKQRLAEHKAKRQAEAMGLGGDDRSSATPTAGEGPYPAPGNEQFGVDPSPAPVMVSAMMHCQSPANTLQQNSPQPPFPSPFAGPPAAAFVPQGMPPIMPPTMSPFPPQPLYGMPPTMFSPPQFPRHPPPTMSPFPYQPRPLSRKGSSQPSSRAPVQSRPPVQSSPLEIDVPGLPARPTAKAPQFSREDMERMHTGHGNRPFAVPPPQHMPAHSSTFTDSLTDLRESNKLTQIDIQRATIRALASDAFNPVSSNELSELQFPHNVIKRGLAKAAEHIKDVQHEEIKAPEHTSKKAGKKSKAADTKTQMVYSDNAVSPEEKRALLSRYAFRRDESTEYVLGDAGPAVTGPVRGADDVMDSQSAH